MNWTNLTDRSYCPYSGKKNACLVQADNGTLYPGVRIENISYPVTIPCEQAAIFNCLSEGDNPERIIYPETPKLHPGYWLEEYQLEINIENTFPSGKIFTPFVKKLGSTLDHLKVLTKKAVIPNSDFPVSALLVTDQGIVEGVNIECSAWNLGLCAERTAFAKAISGGSKTFESISIYVPKSDFSSPCGSCRQVISEWMQEQPVELFHGDGTHSDYHAKHLLPYSLTTSALNKEN